MSDRTEIMEMGGLGKILQGRRFVGAFQQLADLFERGFVGVAGRHGGHPKNR